MATGGATIGALRVVIGADTAALDRGLKQAQSQLSQFGAFWKSFAASLAAGFSFGAIVASIKKTVNEADKLGELAESTGMTTEALSALQFVAQRAGVELDALGTSLVRLAKNMAEAARDPAGQAAQAFKTLGIEIREGVNGPLKSQIDVLQQAAAKFSTYKDSVTKTDAAVAIFGKTGAQMIPILNLGAQGMEAQMQRARELGIVLDTETTTAASNFNDKLGDLTAVKNALWIKITKDLLPALDRLVTVLVTAANNSEGLKNTTTGLANVLRGLITVAVGVATAIVGISTALAGLVAAGILASQGNLTGAVETLKQSFTDTKQVFIDGAGLIKQTWTDTAATVTTAKDEIAKGDAPLINSASNVAKATKKIGDEAKKAAEEMKRLMEEGKQIEEAMLPTQRYAAEVKKLNELFAAGAVSAEAYALKMSHIRFPSLTQAVIDAGDFNKQIDSFSVSSVNTLADGLTDIVTGVKSAKEAFTEMARSILRDLINMIIKAMLFQHVVAPLMGLPTGGAAGFLGVGLPKFAKGGSFKVGGSGPVDSKLVAFRATPGERVDVRTPGQQRDMNQAVNVNAPVRVVNAFDANDFLSKALEGSLGEQLVLNWVGAHPAAFRAALAR